MKPDSCVAKPDLYGSRCMKAMPRELDSSACRMLRLVRGSVPDCTARRASLHGRENAVPKVDIDMH
ncbi:hypothetical protein ACO0LF_21635 [Undibacterium sp. Di27W]|uniref:hypothetical protein n=1 Tax=Undibacterium sp. Di27W TaxID=3413036 RepID=UPI003BF2342C